MNISDFQAPALPQRCKSCCQFYQFQDALNSPLLEHPPMSGLTETEELTRQAAYWKKRFVAKFLTPHFAKVLVYEL
jgi:hypothetical protein